MQTITVVCQPYYPDGTSTSQLFTVLFEELASRDVTITVLCGFPSSEKATARRIPRSETRNGVRVYRCGIRIDHKRNYATRAISYACYLMHVFLVLLFRRRPDVLFGVTCPPFNAQLLWLASCVRGLDYQYMFQDLTREALIALGDLKPHSPIARLWRTANGWSYRRAQKLVVLGRDMIPVLKQNYAADPSRCVYIPHWSPVGGQAAKPLADSSLCRSLQLNEKFIVQYSGNMGLLHDMDTLVRAAQRLAGEDHIHFLFIGGGQRRAQAEQLSLELGLTNVTWHDFVPLAQLEDSLACCHVSLISLRSGMAGIAVPCKLYGILASGRCAIAQVPAESEIALTIEECDGGLVVPPGDVNALVAAIRDFAGDVEIVLEKGRRARLAYDSKYRLQNAAEAFRRLWECETDESVEYRQQHST